MKKRFLSVITSVMLMLSVALATATPSYAYVLGGGSGGDDKAFTSEYAINKNYKGWLLYWIDRNQNVVSDVRLVCDNSVKNIFDNARYNTIYTRYGGIAPLDTNIPTSLIGCPYPYTLSGDSFVEGGTAMKQWISEHPNDLRDNLNAPSDVFESEEDSYFFIAEPVYGWWLYSNKPNVPREMIVGTPYSYSNYLLDNILDKDENYMNATQGLFKPKDDIPNRSLTYYGWWGTWQRRQGHKKRLWRFL